MSADLIERIRERPDDERRWAVWYKTVYPKLYYVAFRMTNGNVDAARDVVQEAFTRFLGYRALDRVVNDQHALSFLIKTCRNVAFDRSARAKELSFEWLEDPDSIAAAEQPNEPRLDLERFLQNLEPADQQVLRWTHDGKSISEIAEMLGVSYTAAGVKLHRLRKKLRESHS